MHPFVSAEVPDWNIDKALLFGGIPSIYLSEDPEGDINSYCRSLMKNPEGLSPQRHPSRIGVMRSKK